MSPGYVLDASALLAALHDEPGGDEILASTGGWAMSSVNWSEVLQKSAARNVDTKGLREDLEALGLEIAPFTAQDAETAAQLWPKTRSGGLSLADRACLALGKRLQVPVLTADKAWAKFKIGVQIQVIR